MMAAKRHSSAAHLLLLVPLIHTRPHLEDLLRTLPTPVEKHVVVVQCGGTLFVVAVSRTHQLSLSESIVNSWR